VHHHSVHSRGVQSRDVLLRTIRIRVELLYVCKDACRNVGGVVLKPFSRQNAHILHTRIIRIRIIVFIRDIRNEYTFWNIPSAKP
jgi:hypothetical protein